MRALRSHRPTAAVLVLAGAATVAVLALPQLRFAYDAPSLRVALETAAAVIALVAAYLVLGRFLRGRGLDAADSEANFVWLPVGERAAALAAALEARAVITRPFTGEGIRVTVGTPEEDDVFLAALDDALGATDLQG